VTEKAWDEARPEATVAALRIELGAVQAIALAVGLAYLEIARPELPPLSVDDARRVVLRDADRYFPFAEPAAISLTEVGGLAFGTPAAALERWVSAFAAWAPVHAIFDAPLATARAIGSRDSHEHSLRIEAGAGEHGIVRVKDGALVDVRRVAPAVGTPDDPLASTNDTSLPDSVLGVPIRYAAAIGALDHVNDGVADMLLNATLGRRMRVVRQRRAQRSYASISLAVLLLIAALNAARDRTLRVTKLAADSLASVSAPSVAARDRLASAAAEWQALNGPLLRAPDPLQTLATLSRALPADAFVERIQWDGKEWRLEGSTDAAAAIVPRLDSQPSFAGVRVLNASMRFRDGARTRESFSVAFRVREPNGGRPGGNSERGGVSGKR
jgi:hypothetical protein